MAAEILGVGFTDASWNALHQTCCEAEFAGRRELLQRSRSWYSAVGPPIIVVVPLPPTTSATMPSVPVPPWLSVATSLGVAFISLPPMVPGMAGHMVVGSKWAKVVVMCRRALIDSAMSPLVIWSRIRLENVNEIRMENLRPSVPTSPLKNFDAEWRRGPASCRVLGIDPIQFSSPYPPVRDIQRAKEDTHKSRSAAW